MAESTSKSIRFTRTWKGSQLVGAVRQATPAATNLAAAYVVPFIVEQTPVETGDLRGSISVIDSTQPGEPAEILVDSVYAAYQHEVPMQHTPGESGEPAGKDHFVSDPLKQRSLAMFRIMANTMKGALK